MENKSKELTVKQKAEIDSQCAEMLKGMLGNPGWKLLEKYLNQKLQDSMTALLLARNDRDIYFNQAVCIVIRQILEKVGVSLQEGNLASEILAKYQRK